MLKIGLTGGIASGKSTVCTLFQHRSIPIIDADQIARQLVEPDKKAYQQIIDTFGLGMIQENRELNRHKLRDLIFSDITAKQQLEAILHPKIRKQLIRQGNEQQTPYCIFVIPLLIESKMNDLVDRILVIDIKPDLQLKRLQQRDGISPYQAQSIINAQCSRDQRLAHADDSIENNGTATSISIQVDKLHLKYLNLAKEALNKS